MTLAFKLSPSAAHRWVPCPGAAFLAPLDVWRPSEYAARGTVAQRVNEICLRDRIDPVKFLGHVDESDGYKITLDASDIDAITQCVDDLRYAVDVEGAQLSIEQSFELNVNGAVIRGRYDFALLSGNYVEVSDYKHGAGHYVSAIENWQLVLYLLAILDAHPDAAQLPKRVSIIQPRHRFGGSTWEIDNERLLSLKNFLSRSVNHIQRLSMMSADQLVSMPEIWNTGEHCKWCPGELSCPAKARALTAAAISGSKVASIDSMLWALRNATHIKDSIKAAENEATRRLEVGEKVPGYKLVQTRPKATGFNESAIPSDQLAVLESIGVVSDVSIKRWASITDARKLARKQAIDIEPYLKYSTPSIVLVDENDKRDEYVAKERLFDAQ